MTEPVLSLRILEAEIHPARLEILEVGTGRDFEISPLPWRPRLEVVALGGAEGNVARAKLDHAVMQSEELQDALGIRRQRFMFGIRLLGRGDLDQLHLVELMHANDPPRLAACGA